MNFAQRPLALVLLLAALLPAAAHASTPLENVPGLEASRLGDLRREVVAFARAAVPPPDPREFAPCRVEVDALLMACDTLTEKGEDAPTTVAATFLVVTYEVIGTTYHGTARGVREARVVLATRSGREGGDGRFRPTGKTVFKVLRAIDPKAFEGE